MSRLNCAELVAYGEERLKIGGRFASTHACARGVIKRPKWCEFCGAPPAKTRLHGHHEDHARGLDVLWICGGCHCKLHNEGSRSRFVQGARRILECLGDKDALKQCPCCPSTKCKMDEPCYGCETYSEWLPNGC